MPYISRNAEGQIVALHREPTATAREPMNALHPEVLTFLFGEEEAQQLALFRFQDFQDMFVSDLGLVRVLEDLIDVLIDKRVIAVTDLPEPAVKRLAARRKTRRHIEALGRALFEKE